MTKFNTKKLVYVAMIAALYATLTLALAPISYSTVQFRISEGLTILPAFTASAVPGLSLGCALANLLGAMLGVNPTGYIDAVVGTFATFLASGCSYFVGKKTTGWLRYLLVPFFPVVINAVIVGAELTVLFAGMDVFWQSFAAFMISVGIGQLVVCYALGVPLMLALEKNNLYQKIFRD